MVSTLARVDFYILTDPDERSRARYACRLAEKAYKLGNRVHLRAASASAAAELDELLWTFRQGSFVPHEVSRGAAPPLAPVTIGVAGETPTGADLLINLADSVPARADAFARVAEIVAASAPSKAQGRERYRAYQARGVELNKHEIGGDRP